MLLSNGLINVNVYKCGMATPRLPLQTPIWIRAPCRVFVRNKGLECRHSAFARKKAPEIQKWIRLSIALSTILIRGRQAPLHSAVSNVVHYFGE